MAPSKKNKREKCLEVKTEKHTIETDTAQIAHSLANYYDEITDKIKKDGPDNNNNGIFFLLQQSLFIKKYNTTKIKRKER